MTDLAAPEDPRESTECTLTDSNQFEYIVYLRQTENASFISFSQYSKIRPGQARPGPARPGLLLAGRFPGPARHAGRPARPLL